MYNPRLSRSMQYIYGWTQTDIVTYLLTSWYFPPVCSFKASREKTAFPTLDVNKEEFFQTTNRFLKEWKPFCRNCVLFMINTHFWITEQKISYHYMVGDEKTYIELIGFLLNGTRLKGKQNFNLDCEIMRIFQTTNMYKLRFDLWWNLF